MMSHESPSELLNPAPILPSDEDLIGEGAVREGLPFFPYRFMAVDVGSNAIKYRVWTIEADGSLRQLCERRFPVRLGEGTFTSGILSEEVIAEAVEAFRGIRQDAGSIGVHAIRAVGTSAMREASNSLTLVARVAQETAMNLEVLPSAEEARLIALGVLGTRPNLNQPYLMIDIGGGSTEVILARETDIVFAQSMRLGAVRLRDMFFRELPPPTGQIELAVSHIRDVLGKTLHVPAVEGERICLGSAGTIATLVAAGAELDKQDPPGDTLTFEQVERILTRLARLTAERVEREFKMDPKRAEIILGGALVLREIMQRLGVRTLTHVRGGVGDGLLQVFLERAGLRRSRLFDHDRAFLIQAVAVGEHYRFNRFHAKQVALLALSLFEQLEPLHQLGPAERRLLKGAALLHEIGQFISFAEHHKHSYYLILHSDLPGLSANEKLMMACVARYHRKAHPSPRHEGYAMLDPAAREKVRKLAAILRIADALDREHQSLVNNVRLAIHPRSVHFQLGMPYQASIEIWNAGQKSALFEEVFGRSARFSILQG